MVQTKTDLPVLAFENQPDWEAWLQVHHEEPDGLWLKIAKRATRIPSVNLDEAQESAMCYGWVDSKALSLDDQYYMIKFTPRRIKSRWSKRSCEKAEALIAAGRMKTGGFEQVEQAKADGRWESAYEPQSQITIPDDLQHALDQNPAAQAFFTTLNSANRYAILHRIQTAKKPETRADRIRKFIQMLTNKEKIYP